jgi:hypothetical protein
MSQAPERRIVRGESAMSNEISVHGLTPVPTSGDTATEQKSEAFAAPATPVPIVTPQAYVNPALRLDAALGLVVIEFRNDSGAITSSIPSQRQLEAYRQHEQTPPPAMTGAVGAGDTTPARGAIAAGAMPRMPDHSDNVTGIDNGAVTQSQSAATDQIVFPTQKA